MAEHRFKIGQLVYFQPKSPGQRNIRAPLAPEAIQVRIWHIRCRKAVSGSSPSCRSFYMKITGSIRRATVAGQADRYKRFAQQCRELAKPLNGRLKQTLVEMADVWEDLARGEDGRDEPMAK
jgi:hypothetical protein